jgi:hypothetical protein
MYSNQYYKLRITEENKVLRKYFTYAERFVGDNNEELIFSNIYANKILNMKIQALNNNGEVIKEHSFFKKEKMPEFTVINRVLLLRNDIFEAEDFGEIKGVSFIKTLVDGNFPNYYYILNFDSLIDCVDWENSKKAQFDFFSKLILKGNKVPAEVDGFFLDKWDNYNKFYTIVNEKMKNILEKMNKAREFLIFDELDIT